MLIIGSNEPLLQHNFAIASRIEDAFAMPQQQVTR
jgi:hypothetical protein